MSRLPAIVDALARRWSLDVGESLEGGTAAFVARVRTAAGSEAILKVGSPVADFASQAATIAAAAGRGYVRLFDYAAESNAMLLEPLGASMVQSGLPPGRQLEVLVELLRTAWEAPADGLAFENKALSLGILIESLWEQLGHPIDGAVVEQALDFVERRSGAVGSFQSVRLHGDAVPANALRVLAPRAGAETGFVLVDPDGFFGDPAYDLGVALRDWCDELRQAPERARAFCRILADRSGLDAQAIWEWGYIERVSTGLYLLSMKMDDLAEPFLATAHLLRRA
ncbi:aminoglycoside phosphotransferase family protein [Corallococcus terminator]|uniref:aminoglycoside phosphotransferase family protein n=1 Tax=Corallococcus terminator TaxID=2316733 RepID=UPI001ABF3811|nr:aminoglycoside phosphotransferase family protein [Corallococcus terminator]